ncbi:accessory gene regulator B family protein [Tissierella carlieri]|uniref:accessory gene regulator ArgB-like protein n=1 Tax=Tissierella carlieri TaxID=689904 RepID=UPI001C11CE9A|nr:accessory gene regulator B family protein [Tissierella carlieri]MBU5314543.1 accessory gene regulator B family protein [Tissierella carlieri]
MDLSEILTDKLISMQIISVEEKDIYSYGFKQGLLLLLNMITIIIIGFFFNMIWQSVIFMVAYSILRVYAGGYHASTPFSCYLFSVVMITAVLWLIKLIPWNGFICFIITTVSCIIILLIAPVEDANKPLDQEEKRIFKKRTNIILGVLIGFALLFWFTGEKQISICIIMGICLISVMLVLGKIKDIKE